MQRKNHFDALTVTLNPAIDRTLTISNFAAGKVNRVEAIRENAGGKGVNVAAALADFGFSVAATGFLGTENADVFETLFAQKGIADHFVRIAGQTRVGIKITDPVHQRTTDINFPGLTPKTSDLDRLFAAIKAIAGTTPKWITLGGSLPRKVNVKIYGELIRTLKKHGHKVLLDASDAPLRYGIDAVPAIIKPNIHELEQLTGKAPKTDRSVIRAAREIVSRGVGLVVVSMSERGACFVNAEEIIIARPPKVDVKSTVGAGDAMVAGIIAAQLLNKSLEECARLATAFSLETLTRTERGIRSKAAIKNWMQRVEIERY